MRADLALRFARRCACVLVAVLAFAPLARAQDAGTDADEAPTTPVTFAVTTPWPAVVNHGWWPAYADITNHTRGALKGVITARSWTHGVDVELPIALAPLETTRIELDLPAFHIEPGVTNDSSYNVRLEVRGRDDANASESIQRDGVHGVRSIVVATPRRIEGGIESSWAQALKSKDIGAAPPHSIHGYAVAVPSTGAKRPDVELAQVLYEELPLRAAAYSSLELVLVAPSDRLPKGEQRAALLAWVRMGGRLVLLGSETLRAARTEPELAAWLEPRFRVDGSSDAAAIHACGLGWIGLAAETDPTDPDATGIVTRLLADFPDTAPTAAASSGATAPPRTSSWMPAIAGLDDVPIRAFVFVLFVFWLLIGPVNFYVVATRWRKPALLLVTIPVLALVFSLLLFGYGIADQGLTTRAAVKSLSLLDQREHRAASVDLRQLFIGFSAGGGLLPGANTVVYPAVRGKELGDEHFRVRAGTDGALSGAFCPVRTPQLLHVQGERSSRLRCDLVEGAGNPRFRNGLDTPILDLVVRGFDGRTWGARDAIAVGAEAELEPLDDVSAAFDDFARRHQLGALPILRGCYLATLDSNSLLDDCALGAREVEGEHALIGILEAPGASEEVR